LEKSQLTFKHVVLPVLGGRLIVDATAAEGAALVGLVASSSSSSSSIIDGAIFVGTHEG
jgi:hypothetical protein